VTTIIIENIEIFKLASWILPKIPFMKYGALIGLILVIVDFIMDKTEKSILTKEVNKVQNELNAVKAQLFDIQKTSPETTTTEETSAPEASKEEL
jgi:hypothetical protein